MKNILKQAAMSILLVALVCSFCITPAMAATEFIGETKENSAVVSDESAELAASSGWVKKSSGRFEYYSRGRQGNEEAGEEEWVLPLLSEKEWQMESAEKGLGDNLT